MLQFSLCFLIFFGGVLDAGRQHDVAELNQFTHVIRAQAYQRHISAEFDRAKDILLP